MIKKILTLLNVLIFISLFLLPTLLLLSANNIIGVASSIKLDDPTPSFKDGKLTLSSTLTIRNPGPFNVQAGITASVTGNRGTEIGITGPQLNVETGSQERRIPVTVEIDLSTISEEDVRRLASNSENFTVEVSAHISLMPIASVIADATAQTQWLPPIHNLTVGKPTVKEASPTQITLEVPFSFENQSPFFALEGEGVISVFDSTDHQVGGGVIKFSFQPSTKWSDSAQIALSPPTNVRDLLLNEATFKYRTDEQITLKGFPVTLTMSQSLDLEWGVLIKSPQVHTSYTPLNSTHTRITATLSFLNNNRFITMDGAITPRLVNNSGGTWVGNTQQLHVPPGGTASLNIEMVVPNSQLTIGSPRLVLGVETKLGSIDLEVTSLG